MKSFGHWFQNETPSVPFCSDSKVFTTDYAEMSPPESLPQQSFPELSKESRGATTPGRQEHGRGQ
jgi:hypothetical protein